MEGHEQFTVPQFVREKRTVFDLYCRVRSRVMFTCYKKTAVFMILSYFFILVLAEDGLINKMIYLKGA